MLTEYYKFHKDISRLFMLPTTHILNKFHDKKRRIEYVRITKMLKEEEEKKTGKPKNPNNNNHNNDNQDKDGIENTSQ